MGAGDKDKWLEHLFNCIVALENSDLNDALKHGEKAVDYCENRYGHAHLSSVLSLSVLGIVHIQRLEFPQAAKSLTAGCNSAELCISNPASDMFLAGALGLIGLLYQLQGRTEDAIAFLDRATAMVQRGKVSSRNLKIAILSTLIDLHLRKGAISDAKEAIKILEDVMAGEGRSEMHALYFAKLGLLHHQQDDIANAKRNFKEAIGFYENSGLGGQNPLHLACRLNLYNIYHSEGNLDAADRELIKGLELSRTVYAATDTHSLRVRIFHGAYLSRNGDMKEAEELLQEALDNTIPLFNPEEALVALYLLSDAATKQISGTKGSEEYQKLMKEYYDKAFIKKYVPENDSEKALDEKVKELEGVVTVLREELLSTTHPYPNYYLNQESMEHMIPMFLEEVHNHGH